jgi:dCMP deaminase
MSNESKEKKWHDRFMKIAQDVSSWSKDESTKVGAVIVRDRVIVSTGYNGFPRGIDDDIPERHERPLKYKYVCHAEENAIFNAARIGAGIQGSDIYVTLHPCTNCAKAIIQSEINNVYILNSDNERWTEDFSFSSMLLKEANVLIVRI